MLTDLPLYPAQHPAQCLANDRQHPISIGDVVLVSDVTRPWELPSHCPLCECCFFDPVSPGSLPVSSSSVALSSEVPGGIVPGSVTAPSRVFTVRELSGCDKRNQGSRLKRNTQAAC